MSKKQAFNLKQADQKLRKTVEMNLISAANELSLPIHYLEILFASTERERVAAAGVLNCGQFLPGQKTDLLFLYLNVPGLSRDFYRVQIETLPDGEFSSKARLINFESKEVRPVRLLLMDPLSGTASKQPAQKVFRPSVEGWVSRKDEYLLFGSLEAGKPFVVAIEK